MFKLTFDQWINIWVTSGQLDNRGQRTGQYCMARFGDKGAYEVGNVRIILSVDNVREACKGKPLTPAGLAANKKNADSRRGVPLSRTHRASIGQGLKLAYQEGRR